MIALRSSPSAQNLFDVAAGGEGGGRGGGDGVGADSPDNVRLR